MQTERTYDVVVMGATGYTGRLVVEYLKERYGDGSLRSAIAGRNPEKLAAVKEELGLGEVPVIVADSLDRESLKSLAEQTRVVCTTVGPYLRYGALLVEVCAEMGTSYCDLCGEVPFIRRMADSHDATAKRTGARLVHACGFDSIPSDLGVFLVQKAAKERFGRPCSEVKGRVIGVAGGPSGGTIESMANVAQVIRHDKEARRYMVDPYSLNPESSPRGPDGSDPMLAFFDPDFGFCAPFIMSGVNVRIVRRSNALMDFAYGPEFSYNEAVAHGQGFRSRFKAIKGAMEMGGTFLAVAFPLLRAFAHALGTPKPGEGPSREQRERGWFELAFLGKLTDDNGVPQTVRAKVRGERDPGYGSTTWMLSESAVCLAKDTDRLSVGGGSWTPASCFGALLIERLNALDMTFEVKPQ